ncbi:MAG: DUF5606 domain-containing protein [Brumimicrobium sp.]
MDLSGIISISGKPGLFKVVAQAKNNIIVESLIDGKRSPAYSTDRISALEDISIYTYEEDVPLGEVFTSIYEKESGKPTISHKESQNKLTDYLAEILPKYDKDRVYASDIKKLFQWYNILHKADALKVEEEEKKEEKKAPAKKEAKKDSEEKETKKAPAKKAADKKPAPKKKPAAKKAAPKTSTKKTTSAKSSATKKK